MFLSNEQNAVARRIMRYVLRCLAVLSLTVVN